MLNTYIKNKGYTKTIIHNNRHKKGLNAVNKVKWDADYDGHFVNINLTSNTNGHKKHFDITLNNNDLENILNVPSVDIPIHERLKIDFDEPRYHTQEPIIYKIELPKQQPETPQILPIHPNFETKYQPNFNELKKNITSSKPKKYLSMPPLSDEELFFPMSINQPPLKKTLRRGNKGKSYRVYKRHKSNSHSKSTKRSHRKYKTQDEIIY